MKSSRYNLFIPQGNGEYAVFNTFSGAIVVLDENAKRRVLNAEVANMDSADLDNLRKCNILVDDATDERQIFSYLYFKRLYSRERAGFTVVTTYACNLRCAYCYEGAGTVFDKSMDEETLQKVLWFIGHVAEISNCARMEIGLFGGEPLLNPDVCFKVLSAARKWTEEHGRTLASWIFTNGTLLTDTMIQKLAEFHTGIRLTLDGPAWYHDQKRVFKDGRGTYNIVLDALERLAAVGMDVSVRIQVAKDNWMHMGELFDDLQRRGLADQPKIKLALSAIMPLTSVCRNYSALCLQHDEMPEAYDNILSMAADKGICLAEKPVPTSQRMFCGFMNEHVFAIDPFGDVYKCISFLGQTQHKIFSIDKNGVGSPSFEYFDFMSRDPLKIAKCRDCIYLPVCSGGCAVLAKSKYGTYHEGDCSQHKNCIEKQVANLVRMRMQPVTLSSSPRVSCSGPSVQAS